MYSLYHCNNNNLQIPSKHIAYSYNKTKYYTTSKIVSQARFRLIPSVTGFTSLLIDSIDRSFVTISLKMIETCSCNCIYCKLPASCRQTILESEKEHFLLQEFCINFRLNSLQKFVLLWEIPLVPHRHGHGLCSGLLFPYIYNTSEHVELVELQSFITARQNSLLCRALY